MPPEVKGFGEVDGSESVFKNTSKRAHIDLDETGKAITACWPDRLTQLPLEILIQIFECLDTRGSFQALIKSRQVSKVCRMAVEYTTDYRFLVDSVRKIEQDLGSERACTCLVYFGQWGHSRTVLLRSLRLARTFQHVQSGRQDNDQVFRSLPIKWLLTQPSPTAGLE